MKLKISTFVNLKEGKSRFYRGKLKIKTLQKIKAKSAEYVAIDIYAPSKGFMSLGKVDF